MMNRMILLIVLAVFSSSFVVGQNEDFFRLSWENLPQNYTQKKKRVETLLNKSILYFRKAENAEQELMNYQELEKNNPLRQMALQERAFRLYLKAFSYVEDAHRIQYEVLKKVLKDNEMFDVEEIKVEWKKQFGSASVLRKKGEGLVPRVNPKSFLSEATKREMEVLEGMQNMLSGQIIAMEGPLKHKDSVLLGTGKEVVNKDIENEADTIIVDGQNSVMTQTGSTISVTGKEDTKKNKQIVKPEPGYDVEIPEPDVSEDKSGEVFFSIQFLATRKDIPKTEVKRVYDGPLPVIENYSDGWHRFSAGKFDSIYEADAEMKKTGINGFVVAFKGEKRISIAEAKKIKY